jgi:hypothetical protein
VFAREYLSKNPPEMLYAFLKLDFAQLRQHAGEVVGLRIALPRLIPIDKAA